MFRFIKKPKPRSGISWNLPALITAVGTDINIFFLKLTIPSNVSGVEDSDAVSVTNAPSG